MRGYGLNAKYSVGGSFPARRTGIVKTRADQAARERPSPSPRRRLRIAMMHNAPGRQRKIEKIHSAPQSVKVIHFREAFLPRISRIARRENTSLCIRAISEIRGCIPFVAAGRSAPGGARFLRFHLFSPFFTFLRQKTGKTQAAATAFRPQCPQSAKNTEQYWAAGLVPSIAAFLFGRSGIKRGTGQHDKRI